MASLKIIGIDPGTIKVGYGIIEASGNQVKALDFGTIVAPQGDPIEKRLALICTDLKKLVDRFSPDCAAIEKAFVGKNVHSALRLGEGRGAVIAMMGVSGLPVFEYTPLLIKKSVVGNPMASKGQVQMLVRAILNCQSAFETEDTSDALAVAICHSHRVRY